MTEQISITITTLDSGEKMNEISIKLIEDELAACVQVEKIESFYVWQGGVQRDDEYRLMIKHLTSNQEKIHHFLRENHPYEVPEILTITGMVNDEYHKWMSST